MLWVGIYVAAASLLCTLAMAADAFGGFRQRKLWLPCRFFTLNAASLTLLAIAMKLPVDLNNPMPGGVDQLATLSSTAFICTIMGNFLPSLGSLTSKELIMNVMAMTILVVTILVNVCIRLYTGVISGFLLEHAVIMASVLFLIIVIISSALVVPIFKKNLELKYLEIQEIYFGEGSAQNVGVAFEKLKTYVIRYWMLAETGNPQFVLTRTATGAGVGTICVLMAFTLAEVEIRMYRQHQSSPFCASDYRWSSLAIFMIQTTGVLIGTIAAAFRLFVSSSFLELMNRSNVNLELKVESYWVQRLVEWKESPLALRIRWRKCRKHVNNAKILLLNICIAIQIVIVIASKVFGLISIFLVCSIFSCSTELRRKLVYESSSLNTDNQAASELMKEDLAPYIFQLEGEAQLRQTILKNIYDSLNLSLRMAGTQQPKHLLEFLQKSKAFKETDEFGCYQIPDLNQEEPPNSWSMSVVTLTSIAIALPNIHRDIATQLVDCVSEGLYYVSLTEKSLDPKGDLANYRNTADVVWLGVELYRKWLDMDLWEMAIQERSYEESLERLSNIGKSIAMEFKRNSSKGGLEENLGKWPFTIVAATSMFRISQALLQSYQASTDQSDDCFLGHISVMISDLFVNCLANLPQVIALKCSCGPIEMRPINIQHAARVLGETEHILSIIQA